MSIGMDDILIYLASPYTDPDPAVMQHRYEAVCKVAAELTRAGFNVLSPIAHSHGLAQHGLPKNFDFWQQVDTVMISRCDLFVILALPGCASSRGVRAETEIAIARGMPVAIINDAAELTICQRRIIGSS